MVYVTFHCVVRRCEMVWKSPYLPNRKAAEIYIDAAPKRGQRARCTLHRR